MQNNRKQFWWRTLISTVLLVLLTVAIMRNRTQFLESLQVVRSINELTLVWMAGLFCVTTACAALTYRLLAFRRAPYKAFYLVELAAAGINRLLPSGVGSMGLHGVFLHRRNHTVPEAVAVVSVNNSLGLVTHFILMAVIIIFDTSAVESFRMKLPGWLGVVAVSIVVIIAVFMLVPASQQHVAGFLRNFWRSIRRYGDRPWHVAGAAASSLGITLVNVLIFAVAVQAVGISASGIELFLIYTVGVLFGSVTPTPGGLGGVEAGLMAGLVAKGVPATQALAAALTFRLATYWFPMVAGTLAFFAARARKLV